MLEDIYYIKSLVLKLFSTNSTMFILTGITTNSSHDKHSLFKRPSVGYRVFITVRQWSINGKGFI